MGTTDVNRADVAAVRHILTSPAIEARTAPYISGDGFDWDGLLAETESMSGGEGVLVRVAHDLWEANRSVGVWELPRRLGPRHFGRVIEALWICRGDPVPDAA